MEDYAFINSVLLPDNIIHIIQKNIQNLQGGGNNMRTDSGVMIGSNIGNNQSSNNFSSQGGGLFKTAPLGNTSNQQNSSSSLFNNQASNNSGASVFASLASSSTPVGQTNSGGSLFSGSSLFAGSASASSNTPSGQANSGTGMLSGASVFASSASSNTPVSQTNSGFSGSSLFAGSASASSSTPSGQANSGESLFSNQQIQNPIVPGDKMPSPSDVKPSLSAEEIKALFPRILTNSSSVSSKFVISNDIGKIEFEGNRDVREKDLDLLSDLKQQIDLLSKSDLSTESVQPHKGERLDKPAMVTLYNCSSDRDGSKKYETIAKKLGCEFINYDEGTRILKIKIIHL